MSLYRLLMTPANNVCDRLGIVDEHERGMMRMLVNMCICAGLSLIVMYGAWKVFI
jgi:hypothetical protein